MAFLEVKHLKKNFGKIKVLDDISFSQEKGRVLAIIGNSGSGKTTLLRCLNFLELPDAGTIELNGDSLFQEKTNSGKTRLQLEREYQDKKSHFGMVFQNYNLFPQYTALENVMLAAKLQKTASESEIRTRAEKLLDMVGLANRADSYPYQLSGGQQQRTAIARALMMQPTILCFDEPTSALDPALTAEVLSVIRDLKNQGHTMIIVTHEMNFVRAAADWVIFLSEGVIAEEGNPIELFTNPKNEKTKAFLAYE